MQPVVCGIYQLFHEHELVYVGKSRDVYKRVAEHRARGRQFDYALVSAAPPGDLAWIEAALIAAFQPRQNRQLLSVKASAATATGPAPVAALTVAQARKRAADAGLSRAFTTAIADGSLKAFPRGDRPRGNKGVVRLVMAAELETWCATQLEAMRSAA
jgi:hypothetical protein